MIRYNDFKNKLSKEQFLYIKQLAENEIYSKRNDYHLCETPEGDLEFIHENEIDESIKVLDDRKEQYFNDLLKKKISHPPLTPIELQLKKNFIAQFKEIDSKIENKRHISETVISHSDGHEDYYSETITERLLKFKALLLIPALLLSFYLYKVLTKEEIKTTVILETPKEIALIVHKNDTIDFKNNRFIFNKIGLYTFDIFTTDSSHYRERKRLFHNDSTVITLSNVYTQNQTVSKDPGISFVKISSNLPGFSAFMDQEQIESSKLDGWFTVESGDHSFEIFKEGYVSQPNIRSFYLTERDSIEVQFNLEKNTEEINVFNATVNISSNIKGADIYINGQNSGYKTNHAFQNMKEGIYDFDVRRNGYVNESNSQTILISKSKRNYAKNFELKKTFAYLNVTTINANADIFINDVKVANTSLVQEYTSGSYKLSFSDVPGFYTPSPREITLRDKNVNLEIVYYPIISMSLNVSPSGFVGKDFNLEEGYSRFDFFRADTKNGPILSSRNGKSFYIFKHPFPYNNPVAGQAIRLSFNLPKTYNYQQPLNLYLTMGYSDESYDIAGKINPMISLYVNNRNQLLDQKLTISAADAEKGKAMRFKINELLRNGKNEIILYVSDKNTVVTHFYKMELRK